MRKKLKVYSKSKCIVWLLVWMTLSMGIVTYPSNNKKNTVLFEKQIIYYVKPGDSLWKIASNITSENEDIRYTLEKIKQDNDMKDLNLKPGSKLILFEKVYNE